VTDPGRLSVLVAITNHGTKNDQYAERVIAEYVSMSHDVEIVVFSNLDKQWGPDVEVRVGCPTEDPWSLPFAHKQLFADRIDQHDLFIYTEDDTLLTEAHIDAFLRANAVLPGDRIPGFMREERDSDGARYISSTHSRFHWDPASVERHGDHTFAYYTNEHAACYVLTRDQLRRVVESGDYLVGPHQSRYALPETAATDPYTCCGLRKLIPISHMEDFVLDHLPNAYLGKIGLPRADLDAQLDALREVDRGERPARELAQTESKVWHARWSKSYHERVDCELIAAVGEAPCRVLSIGTGLGLTEAALVAAGHRVTCVALDSVIAACAERRGLETVYGSFEEVVGALRGRKFDRALIGNLLHLTPDPVRLLRLFADNLVVGGEWIVRTPNFTYLPTVWKRRRGAPGYGERDDFAETGLHRTTTTLLKRWFDEQGLRVVNVRATVNPRWSGLNRISAGVLARRLAPSIVVTARR